jgi:hypothetical protein
LAVHRESLVECRPLQTEGSASERAAKSCSVTFRSTDAEVEGGSWLSGSNNVVLFDNCQSLQNLTVTLLVTEDLTTINNGGFFLQLNCYPQPGIKPQGQTPTEQEVGDLALTWFQYVVILQNGSSSLEIQYWSNNAKCYKVDTAGNCVEPWPPGYNPNPPGTTPWLPVFPDTALSGRIGSAPSSQLLAGSKIEIQLATDPSTGNVVGSNFSVTEPGGHASSNPQTFPTGAQFPIYAFQVDLVAPPSSYCTFTSGAGNGVSASRHRPIAGSPCSSGISH